MFKNLKYFALLLLFSCDGSAENLPEGFEILGSDGIAHFMFVDEVQLGDRVAQREAGRIVCTSIFKQGDYRDVYLWKVKEDVPEKLPIVNRQTVIGVYKMRNGEASLKPLNDDNYDLPVYNTSE